MSLILLLFLFWHIKFISVRTHSLMHVFMSVISKMETTKEWQASLSGVLSSGSNFGYSHITLIGTFLFSCKGNCSIWSSYAAWSYLGVLMCTIENAHCTQPALREDPFSHQIFTSEHRHPAGGCCKAHTLLLYGSPMCWEGKMGLVKTLKESI